MRSIQIGKKIRLEEKKLNSKEIATFIKGLQHNNIVFAACPCRTYTEKKSDRNCYDKNPIGACVFFGNSAVHLEAKGIGRRADKKTTLEYFDFMISLGLDATCDNEVSENSVICLCCGCCCSHLRSGFLKNNSESPFSKRLTPVVNENCLLCGKCAKVCPFNAITIDKKNNKYELAFGKCIGCGACRFVCPNGAITLTMICTNDYSKKRRQYYDGRK